MPRNSGFYVESDVSGGVVTDFTGLNFPEKSAISADNVIFSEKGRIERRKGFDYEPNYTFNTVSRTDKVVNSYLWRSVGGNGDLTFAVLQVGNILSFYLVSASSLSSGKVAQEIDLNTYLVPGSPNDSVECQFASGNGKLFVTHPYADPFYIDYNADTGVFSVTSIILKIRDFEGVVDGLETETRPTTLSNEHKYNLYNQGWYITTNTWNGSALAKRNVLEYWDQYRSDFPSNSDVWHLFKGPANNTNVQGEIFWSYYFDRFALGNSPAPKGHYILDLHYQDRSSLSGITGLPVKTTGYNGVSTVAFFAGRVWYAGIATPGFNQKLYFSQLIERDAQYGQCYQTNDPTSEVTFDLLPTDGGVISIADAGTVLKLFPLDNVLLVFATNGIWAITGSTGIGFTATDYSVNRISSISVLDTKSFIDVNGVPAWMNSEGIYVVRQAQTGLQVQSLTDQKFKKFMDDIPTECKKYARGYFNPYTRVIQWLYRSTVPTSITQRYEFDRALNINVVANSFYPWSISFSEVSVNGLLVIEGSSVSTVDEAVRDNNDDLVTVSSGTVTVPTYSLEGVEPSFKYIVTTPNGSDYSLTFAETINETYTDWVLANDPVIYDSHVSWGYKVQGEGIKKLQVTYIEVYTDNEEQGTFDLQSIWDYATTQETGRWSTKQRCESPSSSYSFMKFKRKLRGHGTAVQVRITSVDTKPFSLVGFSSWITANTRP
jgi:hypothetical protein